MDQFGYKSINQTPRLEKMADQRSAYFLLYATNAVNINTQGECDVWNWDVIITVAFGSCHTIVLASDGMLYMLGSNGYG